MVQGDLGGSGPTLQPQGIRIDSGGPGVPWPQGREQEGRKSGSVGSEAGHHFPGIDVHDKAVGKPLNWTGDRFSGTRNGFLFIVLLLGEGQFSRMIPNAWNAINRLTGYLSPC